MPPRLTLKAISKSFGPIHALQQVNLELAAGEVHAVCGENGAGKSTLMNILSGNLQPDAGEIRMDGGKVVFKNQQHANTAGISIVYQHLSLFDNQNVAENIFTNNFPTKRFGLIDFPALFRQTEHLLEQLKISHLLQPETMVSNLSPGQKQMVEIAKALSRNPGVLILDEPTASLSTHDTDTLFDIIRSLKLNGTSIIYISHRMEEIFEISDRVTVLKDGKLVGMVQTAELTRQQLITMMVGRDIATQSHSAPVRSDVLMEVKNISNEKLTNVSFKIHQGEILALAGLVGAGRTEIAKTIFGAMPKSAGQVRIGNSIVNIQSPADAIRHRMAFVPEERKTLALFPDMSIHQNINSVGQLTERFFINPGQELSTSENYRSKLRITSQSIFQKVSSLSGGNQQKVVLSKWLSTNPKLLIIDEPTHGIDIGAKFEIYDLLRQLAARGMAILLISSELPEVLAISDRVLVVKNGTICKELITSESSEEEILHWAM